MSSSRPTEPIGPQWRHSLVPDGPVLQKVEHTLVDSFGDELEDPWGVRQLEAFLHHAVGEARRILAEAEDGACAGSLQVEDAKSLVNAYYGVLALVNPGSALQRTSGSPHYARMLAAGAIDLGRYYERMMARRAEPHAARGRKTLSAAAKGHAKVHGDEVSKQARWQSQQEVVDRLRRDNPGLSKSSIRELAAKKCGVSPSTIKRHTTIAPRHISK